MEQVAHPSICFKYPHSSRFEAQKQYFVQSKVFLSSMKYRAHQLDKAVTNMTLAGNCMNEIIPERRGGVGGRGCLAGKLEHEKFLQ